MNLYCWIHSTFSVPGMFGKMEDEYGVGAPLDVNKETAHPGVGPEGEEAVYHKYYQWVVFVLFIQVTPDKLFSLD